MYEWCIKSYSSTNVYVVEGGEAVLQCGFERYTMLWQVYSGGSLDVVANEA